MRRKIKKILLLCGIIFGLTVYTSSNVQIMAEDNAVSSNLETVSAQNDTSIGLRNIKIDSKNIVLTDEQKLVLKYFDKDYFASGTAEDYEFMRRYPQIFQGSQLMSGGTIVKVVYQDSETYQILVSIGTYQGNWGVDEYYYESLQSSWVLVEGRTGVQWFIEGDEIAFRGRYQETTGVSIDGVTITMPIINAYECALYSSWDDFIGRFTYEEIKQVATIIFGDAITVREAEAEEVQAIFPQPMNYNFYTVVLDNQSNAKLEKYLMDSDGGWIYDLSSGYHWNTSTIKRNIEFAPDFNHFFIWSMDESLEILTVEYYDKNLNRIWKREFMDTENAVYDYTEYNIYIAANNSLYIINMETGEDTFAPVYIGNRIEVRKVEDGILLFGESKSDAIMKTTNDGRIIWTANIDRDIRYLDGFQIIGNNGVMRVWSYSEDYYGNRFVCFDVNSGQVALEVEATR